jgi:hypothetical protein
MEAKKIFRLIYNLNNSSKTFEDLERKKVLIWVFYFG